MFYAWSYGKALFHHRRLVFAKFVFCSPNWVLRSPTARTQTDRSRTDRYYWFIKNFIKVYRAIHFRYIRIFPKCIYVETTFNHHNLQNKSVIINDWIHRPDQSVFRRTDQMTQFNWHLSQIMSFLEFWTGTVGLNIWKTLKAQKYEWNSLSLGNFRRNSQLFYGVYLINYECWWRSDVWLYDLIIKPVNRHRNE